MWHLLQKWAIGSEVATRRKERLREAEQAKEEQEKAESGKKTATSLEGAPEEKLEVDEAAKKAQATNETAKAATEKAVLEPLHNTFVAAVEKKAPEVARQNEQHVDKDGATPAKPGAVAL